MGFNLGGILKAAVPLAATAFGGPLAGMAAGALFNGAKGQEGVQQLTSLLGAGGGRPGGLMGMLPDLASKALGLFKDATTNSQKDKLLDLAIFSLGGEPGQRSSSMSSSSLSGSSPAPANDVAPSSASTPTPSAASSGASDSSGLSVSGNSVDTGRYVVSASTDKDGQVKILDKQTNTYVEAFGDPHLVTSDGDKANFQKNGLSIKLPDGTTVNMKPTATNDKGVSWLDSVMVEKDGKAVTMSGMHAAGGVKTSEVKTATPDMVHDYTTQGQTVLDASDQDVGDLFMTGPDGQRTTELKSPDKETSLDGMGGSLNPTGTATSSEAKGSTLNVNVNQLDKLSQVLHLAARNVTDRAMQQELLGGIQSVLSTFIKPAA